MNQEPLALLSGGAAQGLVLTVEQQFLQPKGEHLECRFGAVGVMKDALLAGAPCDAMIATAAMIRELQQAGRLSADGAAPLGVVATGIAVRDGTPLPDVSTADALGRALSAATQILFPDPERATAGIHFMSILQRLGLAETLRPRLRPCPNGMTAMRELVESAPAGAIGCTQVTEIRSTPGIAYAGDLPPGCELKTVYVAARSATARRPEWAAEFIALLAGAEVRALRERLGFETVLGP